MHEDVADLVRAARLVDAANLARDRGDLADASLLFERACDWGAAARAALDAGDAERALLMAAAGDDAETARVALGRLADGASNAALSRVAERLIQRGQAAWAARAYEAANATERAAEAWERAGDRVLAARILEAGSDGQGAVRAAHVLEVGLRREPDRPDLLLALGALLLRCGKADSALRALQRVPDEATEKTRALELSLRALTELGMNDGKADILAQLAAKGGSGEPSRRTEPPAAPAGVHAARPRLYGRYEVLREVSSTATARLLECSDVLRGVHVAVKLFSAHAEATRGSGRDALAHFAREARVLGQLAHPNIVPLHEVLEQGPALVLEWMPGGTLEEQLAKEVFTPARSVLVACAVLGALGEAHRLGVVHRDLKPANILFDEGGTPRLSDFGVAHLGDLSVTATAGSFGSLAYMSPEQREGRPATAKSDLFGMGVVLFEMLTGTRAHPLRSGASAIDPPLASVHRHLDARHDAVLASFLAEDPALRPHGAFEARRMLTTLPWPESHDARRQDVPRAVPASILPPVLRLERTGPSGSDGHGHDVWLDRPVACIPLTPRSLARAALFARRGHRALQSVLRVDRDGGLLWLGVPHGARLSRALRPGELLLLRGLLEELHSDGFVHGSVARETIMIGDAGPLLLFPVTDEEAPSADDDLSALARLAHADALSSQDPG